MKNWPVVVLIIAILAVFGTGAYLLYQKSTPTTPATTTETNSLPTTPAPQDISSPADFVVAFYTWYVKGYETDIHFTSSAQFQSNVGQWLAPQFVANFTTLASSTDEDPILLAQDILPTWSTHIQANILDQSATQSNLLVTLGTGGQQWALHVVLINTATGWRISRAAKNN
jgi:hypothetical protein